MTPLPFSTRLWLAWVAYFRVLFDGAFAARVLAVRDGRPALPPAEPAKRDAAEKNEKPAKTDAKSAPAKAPASDVRSALQLLGLLQREGRFVDFVQQDIASFSDADVGTAARVVHEGCRRALTSHMSIEAVRAEEEESQVTIDAGFDAASVKLTGNLQGTPPFKGKLRHKGWRARDVKLPTPVEGHDGSVLAPAEVEL